MTKTYNTDADNFEEAFKKWEEKASDLKITYNDKTYRVKNKNDLPILSVIVEEHIASIRLFERALKMYMVEEKEDNNDSK